ncbi:MAG: hypothetical protein J5546_10100 [Lachnospiraceae bacterium]|nr:hypothetical protein [Lachnospiraceae bacterium]
MRKLKILLVVASLALCLTGCGETAPLAQDYLSGEPISESASLDAGKKTPDPSGGSASTIETPAPAETKAPGFGEETRQSLACFLKTALLPVGNTMYVWGGGWNEEDTGAGPEACRIGVSPTWKAFADKQTSDYDHHKVRYQIHDGLDCSGYVGWLAYNIFETEDGHEGYVFKSTDVAKTFSSYGWGDFIAKKDVKDWKPGDVASMEGHVWISLGTCKDGSVLLVHASPPGVRLCGTQPETYSGLSEAAILAREYMSEYYPDWYERFPNFIASDTYLTSSSQLRWNEETFPDANAVRELSPEELLSLLFGETN